MLSKALSSVSAVFLINNAVDAVPSAGVWAQAHATSVNTTITASEQLMSTVYSNPTALIQTLNCSFTPSIVVHALFRNIFKLKLMAFFQELPHRFAVIRFHSSSYIAYVFLKLIYFVY